MIDWEIVHAPAPDAPALARRRNAARRIAALPLPRITFPLTEERWFDMDHLRVNVYQLVARQR